MSLIERVRDCRLCADELPLEPRPVLQFQPGAPILIVGQAPGLKAHQRGLPFDDPSGERLRAWLGVDRASFYNPAHFALLPMAFCYPGRGASGDLPPPPRCAQGWRQPLLEALGRPKLSILLGQYAIRWHLHTQAPIGQVVANWQGYWPTLLPLPHPSPRNIHWLRQHPWVENDILPLLRQRVAALLTESSHL